MVVERDDDEPRLDPNHLDGLEAEGLPTGRHQGLPERGHRVNVGHELEPELAGETGAKHGRLHAAHLDRIRPESEIAERRQVGVGEPLENLARGRPLHRDHRELRGAVLDPRAQTPSRLPEPVLAIPNDSGAELIGGHCVDMPVDRALTDRAVRLHPER